MADNRLTTFQKLTRMFDRGSSAGLYPTQAVSGAGADNDIILRTHDKNEYNMALLQARQQNLLAKQWRKAEFDITNKTLANLTTIKMMYRDADLMDDFPEIGAAVDIVMEESTYMNDKGFMLNISSKSERIKKILQDLFYNRLQININLPMICRAMVKYGNEFMLLNIDKDNGVMGWKQLPVYEIERFENGMLNPYTAPYSSLNTINPDIPQDTQFIWVGQNEFIPYQHWQIAHFRLLYDSRFLPYGVSFLQKARRHFRMLSMMEDMMLIYRMERSWERRVFKVNVGGVDPEDVPALVQEVANNFKRTPIIDPQTGQIDLRKNILPVWKNTPIPLLDGRTITIEDLAKEYENGKTNYVYSIQDDTKQIVPGKVVWCGKNYTANTMIKVTLDDDSYVVLAPEHEFIMRDGSKKRADELEIGESVMPFYRECDPKAETTKQFINPIQEITENLSNNKKDCIVSEVEYIKGDDVYCMTVVGLNGEEDRHNFALRSFVGDDEWNDSGCFVSNCSTEDYFIPVRDDSAPNPIETLSAAQNLTAIDDLKFIEDKVLTALRVPKSFVSFDTEKAEGKNLSLLDIRFTKTVNRIQQYLIMELNRIAMIHLELLGFEDDITNFNLTMNNPSSQAQMLELENTSKKITAAKDAVSDPGGGIPLYSMTRAWKEILGWSDKEIKDNLEEIRLEKAMSIEIENTAQIIKRTHIFDPVDNIYGESGAEYQPQQQGGGDDGGMMGGGGGEGLGGALDFGGSDMGGAEGEMDMSDAAAEETSDAGMEPEPNDGGIDSGEPPANLAESVLRSLEKNANKKKQAIIQRNINMGRHYLDLLESRIDSYAKEKETVESFDDLRLLHHNHLLNEQLADIHKQLDEKESLNKSYKLLTEGEE